MGNINQNQITMTRKEKYKLRMMVIEIFEKIHTASIYEEITFNHINYTIAEMTGHLPYAKFHAFTCSRRNRIITGKNLIHDYSIIK